MASATSPTDKASAAKRTTGTKAAAGKAAGKAVAAPKKGAAKATPKKNPQKNKTAPSVTSRKAASSRTAAKGDSGKAAMSVGDVFAFGRANVDAVLESGVTVFMGVQDFQAQCWDFAYKSLGQGVEASARLLKCASPKDAMEMQKSLIQDGVERWIQTTQDLSKISNVTALDALSPLSRDPHSEEMAGARHKPTTTPRHP
ncbi:phasin family protein [Varunaivibrio sulfuroxidans]|nr:phasin family protein [Varunaivibrio sulfuroxidans]WES31120.1 phasin family protein [Varunaivibrio sulfuroxidans]